MFIKGCHGLIVPVNVVTSVGSSFIKLVEQDGGDVFTVLVLFGADVNQARCPFLMEIG